MKKVITSILVVCYILALVPAIIVAVTTEQGTTGDCTWKRTGTVLTISGNGKMGDYGGGSPWSDKITEVKISEGVTSIGTRAFFPCKNLNIVKIPDSVTSVGAEAFNTTPFLNNKGNWEDGILYIDDYLIQAQDTIESTCTIKPGTKVIADSAFYHCENLCRVILPDSVISIGKSAFESCENLCSVTIPGSVASVGERAFEACLNLSDITIPDSVISIGERAFKSCWSLSSIAIPDSVTSIGDKAFWFCDNLSEIILPDSITSIGADAFDSTAYANDEVNWNENMLYLGNYLIEINYNDSDVYNVKSSTKVIADDVFSNCKNPSSITIPSSVIHIGEGNNIVTKQTHNIDNYLHFIPLIALAGLGVGAAVFLIIRKSVKKHKSDELR